MDDARECDIDTPLKLHSAAFHFFLIQTPAAIAFMEGKIEEFRQLLKLAPLMFPSKKCIPPHEPDIARTLDMLMVSEANSATRRALADKELRMQSVLFHKGVDGLPCTCPRRGPGD